MPSGRGNFLNAAIPLLEEQRSQAKLDLYQPVANKVMGGLFVHFFRFLQTFLLDYHLWAEDSGSVVLRMMLESIFTCAYSPIKTDPKCIWSFSDSVLAKRSYTNCSFANTWTNANSTILPSYADSLSQIRTRKSAMNW
jgi:hypothetical protein